MGQCGRSDDGIQDSIMTSSTSGQMNLAVAHSLDQGISWSQRGAISIPSARSGSALTPTMDSTDDDHSGVLERLEELCAKDSMYMLRVTAEGEGVPSRTETATHACNLVQSGLRDVFTVHLDWRNKVVGVSITPGDANVRSEASGFRSKVVVQHMEPSAARHGRLYPTGGTGEVGQRKR